MSKVNVLVYTGTGTSPKSIQHTLYTLRRLLTPHYAVLPLTSQSLLNEPWPPTASCLIIPGGADQPYCDVLNGAGNRIITRFVRNGGKYIGFCAGGYYAARKVEWEAGRDGMEVIGNRELGFFPGVARGCAYGGFEYHSERGMQVVELKVDREALDSEEEVCVSYYNGGGVFVPEKGEDDFEVLARYTEPVECGPPGADAAIVYRKIGQGAVLLTGPHPEFAPELLKPDPNLPGHSEQLERLMRGSDARVAVLRAFLRKLGLKGCDGEYEGPSEISPMYLTGLSMAEIKNRLKEMEEKLYKGTVKGSDSTAERLICEKDSFDLLEGSGGTSLDADISRLSLQDDANPSSSTNEAESPPIKQLHICKTYPSYYDTPLWSFDTYFRALRTKLTLGHTLIYAPVTTSTNTLLITNPTLLKLLPHGSLFVASTQIAGRGRGSNIWVSPAGCLMFSLALRILVWPSSAAGVAPTVFVQYLVGMAVVRAIRTYGRGYDGLEIRLKWPNDIYARPSGGKGPVEKIGGILVQSVFTSPETLHLVVGVGINVTNAAPTTSLKSLVAELELAPVSAEVLLAGILASFERHYARFQRGNEMDDSLLEEYYGMWLHDNQKVTVITEGAGGETEARVKGISRVWGQLVVEEVGTGRRIEVGSDGNSFDFLKGLIRPKRA